MLDETIFHPRRARYKEPFGAVPAGTEVRFSVAAPAGAAGCTLRLYREFAGVLEEHPMAADETGLLTCRVAAPAEPELAWYYFRFSFPDGRTCDYGAEGFPDAGRESIPVPPFQLTVYDGSTETPAWFGEGVTYQIFPDRFCRLEPPDGAGMVGDRWVHENWDELMAYQPECGVITNRDFFGGSLKGILSRLDYLESLSVSTIYLNPIFEAASNHRYDTCDYKKIDPMLGTEKDFRLLCSEAAKRGIRVILDGVFNHTGNGSRYFNAHGWYDTLGAAQSQESPWYEWYDFSHWPDKYSCWWGIDTLPQVRESTPSYVDFIIENEDSVIRHWLRAGASGWRLDVADELPDAFIEKLRAAAVSEKRDAVIIGEVWEDGSNKVAYDQRRRYLLGSETHGLMNYPLRNAILDYVRGGRAEDFMEAMETIREHYPPAAFYSALNSLGTHDTSRILTLLGQSEDLSGYSRDWRARHRLDRFERQRAVRRLKLASALLYAFPGSPCIYYGDEAGMEGCEDPFNRGPFPWEHEDAELLCHYRRLGQLRKARPSLRRGSITYLKADGGLLVFVRQTEDERTVIALNAGETARDLCFPWDAPLAKDALTGQRFLVRAGQAALTLPPESGVILI